MIYENQLTRPFLEVLEGSAQGELTTTEVRLELKGRLHLDAEDLAPLRNRPDQRIDQIIRNLKSHKKVAGNPIAEGYVEAVPRGFRITARGRKYLKK